MDTGTGTSTTLILWTCTPNCDRTLSTTQAVRSVRSQIDYKIESKSFSPFYFECMGKITTQWHSDQAHIGSDITWQILKMNGCFYRESCQAVGLAARCQSTLNATEQLSLGPNAKYTA